MEVVRHVRAVCAGCEGFDAVRAALAGDPLRLQVREDGDLYTLMYSKDSPLTHPVVRECVGPIFDKATNELVAFSMPKTEEILVGPEQGQNPTTIPELAAETWEACTVTEYVEGTKVCLYHYKDRWRLATGRMIDAFKARWSSERSFGDQFVALCWERHAWLAAVLQGVAKDPDLQRLQPGVCYTFILTVPENLVVSQACDPGLCHIHSFDTQTLRPVEAELGVPGPEPLRFDTPQQLVAALRASTYRQPGYIVATPGGRYKVLNAEYHAARRCKGDTPDLCRHYLNIRQDPAAVARLLGYFPELQALVAGVEAGLRRASQALYSMYIDYFVRRRERPVLDKPVYVTLCQVHGQYKESGVRRTLALVHEHVASLPPGVQHQLLLALG